MKEKLFIFWQRLLSNFSNHKLLYILVIILLLTAGLAGAFFYNSSKPSILVTNEDKKNKLDNNANNNSTIESTAPSNSSVPVLTTDLKNNNINSKTTKGPEKDESASSAGSGSNSDSSPTTPAEEPLSATVAFYADSQTDTNQENENHKQTVANILATEANPIFHAGDLMEDGTQQSLDYFNDATETLRSTRSFYSAMGNNDRKIGDSSLPSPLYLNNFSLPGNEQWYSVNVGNLHMIILDSAFSWSSVSQRNWLAYDLQSAASQSRITGVMFHHPTFASEILQYLTDNGADFVVSAHIHSYSHSVVNGIDFFTTTGQSSIGYFLTKIYSNSALFNIYNHDDNLVETITVTNR